MECLKLKNKKGQKIIGLFTKPEGEITGTCVIQHGCQAQKNSPTF